MIHTVYRSTGHLSRREFLRGSAAILAVGVLAACAPLQERERKEEDASGSTPGPVPVASMPVAQAVDKEVIVLIENLDFPEGPAFAPDGSLWCTEMNAGNLVQFKDGQAKRFPTQGKPNGLAFDRAGRAWMCDSGQNAIRRFNPGSGTWETLLTEIDGQPLLTPNDLAFDPLGNLLFTCPNFHSQAPEGYVCCLKPDGTARKIAGGFYRPNGLDFVEDGKVLVVGDTLRKTLYKGDWDAVTCSWNDPQPWVEVGGSEGPDGMLPGADGQLYVAIYGDGVIRVISESGKVARSIPLPGANPTNISCDPAGRLGLVVTEAEKGLLLGLPGQNPGAAIFDGGDYWD